MVKAAICAIEQHHLRRKYPGRPPRHTCLCIFYFYSRGVDLILRIGGPLLLDLAAPSGVIYPSPIIKPYDAAPSLAWVSFMGKAERVAAVEASPTRDGMPSIALVAPPYPWTRFLGRF